MADESVPQKARPQNGMPWETENEKREESEQLNPTEAQMEASKILEEIDTKYQEKKRKEEAAKILGKIPQIEEETISPPVEELPAGVHPSPRKSKWQIIKQKILRPKTAPPPPPKPIKIKLAPPPPPQVVKLPPNVHPVPQKPKSVWRKVGTKIVRGYANIGKQLIEPTESSLETSISFDPTRNLWIKEETVTETPKSALFEWTTRKKTRTLVSQNPQMGWQVAEDWRVVQTTKSPIPEQQKIFTQKHIQNVLNGVSLPQEIRGVPAEFFGKPRTRGRASSERFYYTRYPRGASSSKRGRRSSRQPPPPPPQPVYRPPPRLLSQAINPRRMQVRTTWIFQPIRPRPVYQPPVYQPQQPTAFLGQRPQTGYSWWPRWLRRA